jgi:hypothetical protein
MRTKRTFASRWVARKQYEHLQVWLMVCYILAAVSIAILIGMSLPGPSQ